MRGLMCAPKRGYEDGTWPTSHPTHSWTLSSPTSRPLRPDVERLVPENDRPLLVVRSMPVRYDGSTVNRQGDKG
jgi:hypothetical protein